jgi:hypothetical protein
MNVSRLVLAPPERRELKRRAPEPIFSDGVSETGKIGSALGRRAFLQ